MSKGVGDANDWLGAGVHLTHSDALEGGRGDRGGQGGFKGMGEPGEHNKSQLWYLRGGKCSEGGSVERESAATHTWTSMAQLNRVSLVDTLKVTGMLHRERMNGPN